MFYNKKSAVQSIKLDLSKPLTYFCSKSTVVISNMSTSSHTLFLSLSLSLSLSIYLYLSLIDLFKLRSATNKYHRLITSAKRSFNFNLILKSASNPRLLIINSLLHRSPIPALPTVPLRAYLSAFCYILLWKGFQTSSQTSICALSHVPTLPIDYNSFQSWLLFTTSVTEISTLISECTNSYCDLDPIPTSVLKLISSSISSTICNIVNLSLSTGTFPSPLTASIVTLLIKLSLDKEDLANYRSISNLSTISKNNRTSC